MTMSLLRLITSLIISVGRNSEPSDSIFLLMLIYIIYLRGFEIEKNRFTYAQFI